MKILETFPPNYASIEVVFPKCREYKAIFSYGGVIYNPFGREITPDVEIHEEVHMRQQLGNSMEWWYNYLTNSKFRLDEEIEAWATQYKFIKEKIPTKFADHFLDLAASELSGEQYGNLVSYAVAKSRIRNYAKGI